MTPDMERANGRIFSARADLLYARDLLQQELMAIVERLGVLEAQVAALDVLLADQVTNDHSE